MMYHPVQALLGEYQKGEASVAATANRVGFRLPFDPDRSTRAAPAATTAAEEPATEPAK